MARFWISNTHEEGQCDEIGKAVGHVPPKLSGTEVYCTCPAGEHAYFMVVDGETPESVLDSLPEALLIGSTRALQMASVAL